MLDMQMKLVEKESISFDNFCKYVMKQKLGIKWCWIMFGIWFVLKKQMRIVFI